MTKQQGFTLIELIAVIVIISIIAFVAIPRFFDYTNDAYSTKVRSTASAFSAGVNLVNSSWLAQGGTTSITTITSANGDTITVNANGYPKVSSSQGDILASSCLDVFNTLISNPPSNALAFISDFDFTTTIQTDACIFTSNGNTNAAFLYYPVNGLVELSIND